MKKAATYIPASGTYSNPEVLRNRSGKTKVACPRCDNARPWEVDLHVRGSAEPTSA